MCTLAIAGAGLIGRAWDVPVAVGVCRVRIGGAGAAVARITRP